MKKKPRYVFLTQKAVALVDFDDYDKVAAFCWHLRLDHKTHYAVHVTQNGGSSSHTAMHRLLMPGARIVDHINGNGLDNRRCNLRECSVAENSRNRGPSKNNKSGFKGVVAVGSKWAASITVNRKQFNLGRFDSPQAAARAYDAAAIRLHGAFAKTNFTTTGAA